MWRKASVSGLLGVSLLLGVAGYSAAELGYPKETVKLVSAFAAGGGNDFMARQLAQKFQELYKGTFIVEDRPGGNGDIATNYVASAKPDGNTLLVTTNATIVINPQMFSSAIRFDPVKDFAPVSLLARQPFMLVVSPKLKVKTMPEFVAYAKAHADKLNYGSSGAGGGAHLAGEMLNARLGIKMQHIPYKGIAPALQDLIGGRIDLMFGAIQTVRPFVDSGQIVPIAVSSLERNSAMPNIPAVAEFPGFEGFESDLWYGLLAPAGTDPAIVESLAKQTTASFKDPAVRSHFEPYGTVLIGSTPQQFADDIKTDLKKWSEVLSKAGLARN